MPKLKAKVSARRVRLIHCFQNEKDKKIKSKTSIAIKVSIHRLASGDSQHDVSLHFLHHNPKSFKEASICLVFIVYIYIFVGKLAMPQTQFLFLFFTFAASKPRRSGSAL